MVEEQEQDEGEQAEEEVHEDGPKGKPGPQHFQFTDALLPGRCSPQKGAKSEDDEEDNVEQEVSINLEDAIATAEEINKQGSVEQALHYA